jgi:tripartite-type tricarboxylate transporter receptor subunit TctC
MARALVQELSANWKATGIVEIRSGANGSIGTAAVARSNPDGYTLLLTTNATIVINPQLFTGPPPYDPVKDLAPISLVSAVPFVFVVPPSFPAKTFQEFLAFAKANPGKLNCGSSGTGGGAHLALEMLKLRAGVDITHVPYKGSAPSLNALLGSHIDCLFVSLLTVAPLVKQGQLRALAVSSPDRNPALADIPAVAEFPGLDGFESDLWYGFLAPAGTDPAIVQKLHTLVASMLADSGFRDRFASTGAILVGNTPAEFASRIQQDLKKWADVIRQARLSESQ